MAQYEFSVVSLGDKQSPEIVIDKRKDYVQYGEKNDFMEYCLMLFMKSGMHHSLIEGKTTQIFGKGIKARNQSSASSLTKLKSIFSNSEQCKCLLDKQIHGNYALKILTNKAGKIVEVKHFPVHTLRPEIANEDGVVENYYYKKDWSEKREDPEKIKAWLNDGEKKKGEFIYFVNAYNPNNQYFGAPEYVGALKAIETDIEIADYHLTNIQSGFSAATIVQFNNGIPTPQERIDLEKDFKKKFTGTKGRKFIMLYNDDPDKKVDIFQAPIPEADKQYEFLAKHVTEQILIGHRVTSPMLVGVRTATGLGNNADEIKTAQELFFNLVIHPEQRDFIDEIRPLLSYSGIVGDLFFEPLEVIKEKEIETASNNIQTRFEKIELNEEEPFQVLTDEHSDWLLDQLENAGEDESELLENGFTCVSEEDLQGDDELQVTEENSTELASAYGLTPNKLSKYDVKKKDGSGVWLVRYQYALASELSSQPAIIDTSRSFCKTLIDAAKNGNRVYKRELLEDLTNPDFGSYNIFWYKGSYNCRHVWKRKLYFKPSDWTKKDGNKAIKPVGNVPYVAARVNDRRATKRNTPVRR